MERAKGKKDKYLALGTYLLLTNPLIDVYEMGLQILTLLQSQIASYLIRSYEQPH